MAALAKLDTDKLLADALSECVGASTDGIKARFYNVLHEFFNDSSCWLEDLTISIVADQREYSLAPADGGRIIRLAGVVDANGLPQPCLMPNLGTLLLRDNPNSDATWTVTVIKNVTMPTNKDKYPFAPDWVLPQFGPGILAGVVGRMKMQKDRPYSDPATGAINYREFRNTVNMSRVATLRRNTFGSQSWAYPQSMQMRTQRASVSTISPRP